MATLDVKTPRLHDDLMKLLSIRLGAEDARRAAALRKDGIAVSRLVREARGHDPDWADGYLAVVAGIAHRARMWTYDREFRTTWRRPDGTRIPLAVAP